MKPKRLALLIGNSHYDDKRLSKLKKPGSDVARLAKVLREPSIGHYDVTTLIDGSTGDMRRAIARLLTHKFSKDQLLLYFSGHGIKDDLGRLYLAARDTDSHLPKGTALEASFIAGLMNDSHSLRQIVILDCCFSGAFVHGAKEGASGQAGVLNAFKGNGTGRVILTATDSVQYALEGDPSTDQMENSIFTHHLVQGLESGEADLDRDGKITVDELYEYVYEHVVRETPGQTPEKWSFKQKGEFIIALNPRAISNGFGLKGILPPGSNQDDEPRPPLPIWREGRSPYRGLRPFKFKHAPIFFGRSRAVSEILSALRAQASRGRAFVLVLGMSGGGKSSVVQAGVLPQLIQPDTAEEVNLWRRAVLRPSASTGDLFDALVRALLHEDALPELAVDGSTPEELAQNLREAPWAVLALIKNGLSQAAFEETRGRQLTEQPQARLALVVDQMEEIFTLARVTHAERQGFIAALDALARGGRVWVLATLRSDFYARCGELDKLVDLKRGEGQYDLLPPTMAEIGQMIRQPARVAGLRFEKESTREPLDEVLLDAAANSTAVLPLLAFALEELFKRQTPDRVLTHESYRDVGGVDGALAQRAEEVLQNLDPEVREVLPRVLRALVRLNGESEETVSRQRAPLEALTVDSAARNLVEAFVEARLFVTELADDGTAVVSLVHEALLRHWPRLRTWLEENREYLRIRKRTLADAARWQQEGRSADFLLQPGKPLFEARELLLNRGTELPDRERDFIQTSLAKRLLLTRLRRLVTAALVVLTLVACVAAWFAGARSEVAKRQEEEAEGQKRLAKWRGKVAGEAASQTLDFMIDLFALADSENQARRLMVTQLLEYGVEQIEQDREDRPEAQARLARMLGRAYAALGLCEEALPLVEKALAQRQRQFQGVDARVAESLHDLGLLMFARGEFANAELYLRQAVNMWRDLRVSEQPGDIGKDLDVDLARNLARSLTGLGLLLEERDGAASAASLLKEALELYAVIPAQVYTEAASFADLALQLDLRIRCHAFGKGVS